MARSAGVMNIKRVAIILSLVSLLVGSAVSPAYSVQDKCLTTKKFKEVDKRTYLMMTKNISKYTNQAFVLQAYISEFSSETTFLGYWWGKGGEFIDGALNPAGTATGLDTSKNKKRFAKLVVGDKFKAKVIIFSSGSKHVYQTYIVCSATILPSTY